LGYRAYPPESKKHNKPQHADFEEVGSQDWGYRRYQAFQFLVGGYGLAARVLRRSIKNFPYAMQKDEDKANRSFLAEEKWLLHTVLAAGAASVGAALAVLAGWWGGLSSLIVREIPAKLLLDTVGILLLVCFVLLFSLYRKIRASAAISRTYQARLSKPSNKPVVARLPELQERVLIHAANHPITPKTLADISGVHPEESKFHFAAIKNYIEGHSSHSTLSDAGRAYLVRHGIMPVAASVAPPQKKPKVPGSGIPPLISFTNQQ